MKKCKHGLLWLLLCIGYGLISLYGAYLALPISKDRRVRQGQMHHNNRGHFVDQPVNVSSKIKEFSIWDTCGVGLYLYKNIFHGEVTRYNLNNEWIQSTLEVKDYTIRYNLGYGLTPDNALAPSQPNIILVVHARDDLSVTKAKDWIDYMLKSAYIKNIALLLLGSETCDNDWLQPYLQHERIKCLFLIYDSPLVDNELVYQWPLGVASYRDLRTFGQEFLDLTAARQYVLNFIGTVHNETSRVAMMDTVKQKLGSKINKYVKTQDNWVREEDSESMANYQQVLLESDLTLSPVGRNSECYRTYEAMEMGSIPVIEDVMTEGTCEYSNERVNISSPYRLLKQYKAPVIFVKNWEKELPDIIKEFDKMPLRAKVKSRINLIRWYVDFKKTMRDKFLDVIERKFFLT